MTRLPPPLDYDDTEPHPYDDLPYAGPRFFSLARLFLWIERDPLTNGATLVLVALACAVLLAVFVGLVIAPPADPVRP